MAKPSSRTMLDVDTILGLPRPTKKPSSLKKPRQPPPPKYINKERALAIAKKFKIAQIGKVSVRAGMSADTIDDQPSVSLQSDRVLTRRILLDREKGLETAMNTKDSAVGKCILGRNDYETRRLGVEFDKLKEDGERRQYQLLRRKSVFVHKRGLTLTQNGIVFDTASATMAGRGSTDPYARRDSTKPRPAQHHTAQQAASDSKDIVPRPKRDKSPSYMRPLSCKRNRSTDSQVAEAERFLKSPTMRQFTKLPDDDSTLLALKSVSEMNSLDFILDGHQTPTNGYIPTPKSPATRTMQTETTSRVFQERKQSELPEIAESVSSTGSEHDRIVDSTADEVTQRQHKVANFPITNVLSRSMSDVDQSIGLPINSDEKRRHSTAYTSLGRSLQTVHKPSNVSSEQIIKTPNEAPATTTETRGRPSSRRRSRRKSSMLPTQKRYRRKRVSFSQNPGPTAQFNVSSPSKDPRFTELTSFLIPDSAKAFELYRAMGRLSVLDRLNQESGAKTSAGIRTKRGKAGQNRKNDNLKAFDTL